jgi:hypothetical protein
MTTKTLREIRSNTVIKKRLAKVMALQCFRNTKLEDLHAGISPSSETGDFSDIKVVSPYGEIPWTEVSRFNDDEMKELMIDVVDHCYNFILLLCNGQSGNAIVELLKTTDVKKDWEDPSGLVA